MYEKNDRSTITSMVSARKKEASYYHWGKTSWETYSVREFANRMYTDIVEINFERQLEYQSLFEQTRDPKDILEFLNLSFRDVTFDKNTLLFFDEIQASSSALTALKFLSENFPCDIICTGSMLGVAIAGSTSFPVGYISMLEMRPLNKATHDKMNNIFREYVIVGGMPEVVNNYKTSKSFTSILNDQRRIVNDYRNDMAKSPSGNVIYLPLYLLEILLKNEVIDVAYFS